MKTILVNYNQPCLDITILDVPESSPNHGKKFGLNRDRQPDAGWDELRKTTLEKFKEVDLKPELKQILIEDLAFTYGNNTLKFSQKMKEFDLY